MPSLLKVEKRLTVMAELWNRTNRGGPLIAVGGRSKTDEGCDPVNLLVWSGEVGIVMCH